MRYPLVPRLLQHVAAGLTPSLTFRDTNNKYKYTSFTIFATTFDFCITLWDGSGMPQGVWDSVALKSAEHCITLHYSIIYLLSIDDGTIPC